MPEGCALPGAAVHVMWPDSGAGSASRILNSASADLDHHRVGRSVMLTMHLKPALERKSTQRFWQAASCE